MSAPPPTPQPPHPGPPPLALAMARPPAAAAAALLPRCCRCCCRAAAALLPLLLPLPRCCRLLPLLLPLPRCCRLLPLPLLLLLPSCFCCHYCPDHSLPPRGTPPRPRRFQFDSFRISLLGGGSEKLPVFSGVPGRPLWSPYGHYGVTMVRPSNRALCLWRLCLACEQGKLKWARERAWGTPPLGPPWALPGPWGPPSLGPAWALPGPWAPGPWAQRPQKPIQQLKKPIQQLKKQYSS